MADARWNRVANLRLLAAAAAAAAIGWGLWQGPSLLIVLGVVLFAVFVALIAYHNRLDLVRRRAALLYEIDDEARQRLARDWDALPVRHTARAAPDHPYARDLDLFGRASLFALLDSVGTYFGETTLQGWLLAAAPPDVVAARQPAVAELASLIDLRDALTRAARLMGTPRPDPEPFLAWAESAPWLPARQGLLWAARINVALLWILLLAQAGGLLPYPFWTLCVAANAFFNWRLGAQARQVLEQVGQAEAGFQHYAESFALLAGAPLRAPLLRRLQADLAAGGLDASTLMRRLHRRATIGFPQDSIVYLPVQLLTLWDVHAFAALEGWQALAGRHARAWLAALGEAEALAALAVLAHDNPDWAFPALDPAAPACAARGLGHPLLPAGARVVNDVTVGPAGTFLLVTGSNMSGKSTLLRALGVNVVLAGAGGPVCAAALALPPVALWTSMRIEDSLERGVSYFMAELERLKAIVEAARARAPGDPPLCYLLDEILQGTNTAERQVAARRIIAFLVQHGALGAVSTHDLGLADTPALAAVARPIHFSEQVGAPGAGPALTFDYRIRPGLATSSNALRLMALMGLDLPAP